MGVSVKHLGIPKVPIRDTYSNFAVRRNLYAQTVVRRAIIKRNLPLDIIEGRSSKLMTSIRNEDPTPQGSSHLKHQKHAISVERKVISKESVKLRPKPLSIPSLMTKPAGKKSSNS